MAEEFAPYMDNKKEIEVPYKSVGPFFFSKHMHKPLGPALWDDIIHCLKPRDMIVYKENSGRTPLGSPCSLTVIVDENLIVKEIAYQAWYS